MLASTVQFSTYNQTPATRPRQTPAPTGTRRYEMQTGPDTERNETPPGAGPLSQDPTACLRPPPPPLRSTPHPPRGDAVLGAGTAAGRTGQRSTLEHHPTPAAPRRWGPSRSWARLWTTPRGWRPVLLRKEVIQPHLPVRLPCYDFVPIADPAFDGSLHKGWATGFGRYRLS
jgi:hypothetical protein